MENIFVNIKCGISSRQSKHRINAAKANTERRDVSKFRINEVAAYGNIREWLPW